MARQAKACVKCKPSQAVQTANIAHSQLGMVCIQYQCIQKYFGENKARLLE